MTLQGFHTSRQNAANAALRIAHLRNDAEAIRAWAKAAGAHASAAILGTREASDHAEAMHAAANQTNVKG